MTPDPPAHTPTEYAAQAAQEMRREVRNLCYQCGEPLPADVLQYRHNWGHRGREHNGFCNDCYDTWCRSRNNP